MRLLGAGNVYGIDNYAPMVETFRKLLTAMLNRIRGRWCVSKPKDAATKRDVDKETGY
jgi:hypothetical protein